ncbi:hypothetical protein NKOR_03305 [Candidatus Nitrosopumilus koreensis AR1]|uniref:Uncharacterized protein n=1 Tax=Candidatus Nitrosopumilus koreensis AR1 TaxID=1229908 RepID=K0B6J3_9ARCH|nr:hypothetical protein NKOR_03305 [Candidatus Nitrosopumilus koreensis AR1]
MTSNVFACKTKLSEERVIHTTEYMHKDIPDGTEVCILKRPLTLEEWSQILQNQEIVTKMTEQQDNSTQNPNEYVQKINSTIEYGENKIRQIQKRISKNEVNQESMESHSDYDYKDLLKELNESEKEHKKDLRLFLDLLCKYKIIIK